VQVAVDFTNGLATSIESHMGTPYYGNETSYRAIFGVTRADLRPRKHVITCAIEHPAVLSPAKQLGEEGVEVTCLRVGSSGIVAPEDVRRALRPETVLVSIMHANNELGTLQPVAEIARIAHEAGAALHVDGVQALGKTPVDVQALGADLYTMSGHKLYAPKGVGALYVRKGTRLAPIAYGGHHERDRRPGTENVPGIAAFGAAAELAGRRMSEDAGRLGMLRDRLENAVLERIPGTGINGSRWLRVANQQYLLRRSGWRGHGDRARPARLCRLHRSRLLERRAHAFARAHRHRPHQ
jgi:cysteine desulfurase